jgi:predicted DNA-binding protein with PD1-like motif
MKKKIAGDQAQMRLERGEELITALVDLTHGSERTFSFTVIGATTDVELGFYHLEKKEYSWKRFVGEFEVVGGVGNSALFGNEPFVHLHATIADEDFRAYGGHVRKLIVGATCEVSVVFHEEPLRRERDEEIGLNLWDLRNE